jgi:uncharacterized protein YjdB
MKTRIYMNIGRFIHANRVPLAAVIGLAALGGCEAGSATIVDPSAVQSVSVNPTSVTATVGGPAQPVQASVDVVRNASQTVTWTSSDPSVASVAPSGESAMVTGLKAGTATITATSTENSDMHADASVRVMPGAVARIVVTASAAQVTAYATLALRAVALDAAGDTLSGTTFSWSSSNSSVASVSGSGVVTGVAPGAVSMTAMSGSITSSAYALTVVNPPAAAVAISAPSSSIPTHGTTQAVAVVHDAAGHALSGASVAWASSNTQVATVSSSGLVTGVSAGDANITATSGQAKSNTLAITVVVPVVASITVTAPSSSMSLLSTMQAQAVARDASGNVLPGISFVWASSNSSVASVSNSGLITANLVGTADITASSGGVTSNAFTVTVSALP